MGFSAHRYGILALVIVLGGALLSYGDTSDPADWGPTVQDRGITFGAEFEFSNKNLVKEGGDDRPKQIEKDTAEKFMQRVSEKCPLCTITKESFKWGDEYKVQDTDGYWFRISYDPGCVEIQTEPATLSQLRTHAASMNELIFKTAHEVGLDRDWEEDAGHMNFGAKSAFGNDGKKSAFDFMEYVDDFSNHPQIAEGAIGEDYTNAPPLNHLQQQQRDAFAAIVSKARQEGFDSVKDAANAIQNQVYTRTALHNGSGYHYQALSMKQLNKPAFPAVDAPLEIRAEYPQGSMEDFIRDAEVISRRVEYLKATHPPLTYFNIREHAHTYEDSVDMYYKYLEEMGLPYDKYRESMHPNFQKVEPGGFVRGKITWTPRFARSVTEFTPHIQTSPWVRAKMLAAFTDPMVIKSESAQRSFVTLLKSLRSDSPAFQTEVQFAKEVLNHPTWKNIPARAGILRMLQEQLPQVDWSVGTGLECVTEKLHESLSSDSPLH